MRKQKMERLDSPLFRPLSDEESQRIQGGDVHTDHISLFPTADPAAPDMVRDSG